MSRDWLDRLRERGALLEGHFRLSSGLHSPHYVQCARLLQHPEDAAAAAEAITCGLEGRMAGRPSTVVSPAIGGIVLGHEVARAMGARAVWAERDAGGGLSFRRGFSLEPGEPVVAVEDVVTTAGSLRELIAVAERHGARVAAVAMVVDRSGGAVEWPVPSVALATLAGVQWEPSACPLCEAGEPVEKPGSRPGA